jgi:hypothetical protein
MGEFGRRRSRRDWSRREVLAQRHALTVAWLNSLRRAAR